MSVRLPLDNKGLQLCGLSQATITEHGSNLTTLMSNFVETNELWSLLPRKRGVDNSISDSESEDESFVTEGGSTGLQQMLERHYSSLIKEPLKDEVSTPNYKEQEMSKSTAHKVSPCKQKAHNDNDESSNSSDDASFWNHTTVGGYQTKRSEQQGLVVDLTQDDTEKSNDTEEFDDDIDWNDPSLLGKQWTNKHNI